MAVRLGVASSRGECDPWYCIEGSPHEHCACGLAMAVGAGRCRLCRREGLAPTPTHPSRRQHRIAPVPPEAYTDLLRCVLGDGRRRA